MTKDRRQRWGVAVRQRLGSTCVLISSTSYLPIYLFVSPNTPPTEHLTPPSPGQPTAESKAALRSGFGIEFCDLVAANVVPSHPKRYASLYY
jgi:hypothetical protein